jgi:hypothetical protein
LAPINNIYRLLVTHGADVNFVYPENLFKPAFSKDNIDQNMFGEGYEPDPAPYKTTFMINLIRKLGATTLTDLSVLK